jgi:DNA-binding NarL/FixJ family response regulator
MNMKFKNDKTLKVLIVDDNELLRLMLEMELEQEPDFEVVGTATDGLSAITKAHEAKPDVIIMDLQMPKMDGLTASKYIKKDFPEIPIIAYTSVLDPQVEVMADMAAIDRFCYKDTTVAPLIHLIRQYKPQNANNHE